MPPRRVSSLILDTGAFIQRAAYWDLADTILTTPDVIGEVKDTESKIFLANAPVQITLKEPSAEGLRAVSDFAKLTGDYAALSRQDLGALALAYDTDVSLHNGSTEHLRSEPLPIETETLIGDRGVKAAYAWTTEMLPGYGVATQTTEWHSFKKSSRGAKKVDEAALRKRYEGWFSEPGLYAPKNLAAEEQEVGPQQDIRQGETQRDEVADSVSPAAADGVAAQATQLGAPDVDHTSEAGVGGQTSEAHREENALGPETREEIQEFTHKVRGDESDPGRSDQDQEGWIPVVAKPRPGRRGRRRRRPNGGVSAASKPLAQAMRASAVPVGSMLTSADKAFENGDWITTDTLEVSADYLIEPDTTPGSVPPATDTQSSLGTAQPPPPRLAGLYTIDFAMQNVALQMGITVLSERGVITGIRRTAGKCTACLALAPVYQSEFCKECGNRTMMRVMLIVDSTGHVIVSERQRDFNLRGTIYNMPCLVSKHYLGRAGRRTILPISSEGDPAAKYMLHDRKAETVDGSVSHFTGDISGPQHRVDSNVLATVQFLQQNPNEGRKGKSKAPHHV